jgi:hypothetical protein
MVVPIFHLSTILNQTVGTGTLEVIQTMARQPKITFSKTLLDVRVHLLPKYLSNAI